MSYTNRFSQAVCHFTYYKNNLDNGYATLTQYPDKTIINLDLYNLPAGKHGFHIHEYGDMRQGCMSTGSHYNPFKHSHGDLNKKQNHVGDLGNIIVDEHGRCSAEIIVNFLPLMGTYGVIGRSMVIHKNADDLGLGHNKESKQNGNSGNRISCGVIGHY